MAHGSAGGTTPVAEYAGRGMCCGRNVARFAASLNARRDI
jgi:hypothetical protein